MKYKTACSSSNPHFSVRCPSFTPLCMPLHMCVYGGKPKAQSKKCEEQKTRAVVCLALGASEDQRQLSTGETVYLWSCSYRRDAHVNYYEI